MSQATGNTGTNQITEFPHFNPAEFRRLTGTKRHDATTAKTAKVTAFHLNAKNLPVSKGSKGREEVEQLAKKEGESKPKETKKAQKEAELLRRKNVKADAKKIAQQAYDEGRKKNHLAQSAGVIPRKTNDLFESIKHLLS